MAKKPWLLSNEDFLEYERVEAVKEDRENFLRDKGKNNILNVPENPMDFDDYDTEEMRELNGALNYAMGISGIVLDENGRQIYAPDTTEFDALNRNWVSVVGRNGEYLSSALEIYKHYDLNIPAGMRETMSEGDVAKMYYNMRRNFEEKHASFLNTMVKPSTYAKFKGVDYLTVLRHIKEGVLTIIVIDGVQFVVIQADDMDAFEDFLMERMIATDTNSEQMENERLKTLQVWQAKHKKKCEIEPENNVFVWLESTIYNHERRGDRCKQELSVAYNEYQKWCKHHFRNPMGRIVFTKRMDLRGFKFFRGKVRGFYYYN